MEGEVLVQPIDVIFAVMVSFAITYLAIGIWTAITRPWYTVPWYILIFIWPWFRKQGG